MSVALLLRRGLAAVLFVMVMSGGALWAGDQIDFTTQTLPNGLQVIYAPLHQAPVVHVQVLYHVGSKNEAADRQGFAHMFEHMMFRGSAHVKPQEHLKLIQQVGGEANAYTSFDETVYHETLPANQLKLALYLEADRMASFKVSDEIYATERMVVNEEARMRANQPFGLINEAFLRVAYLVHSYRWAPIGNMEDLRAAQSPELQTFFNRYYVPNNAYLVIAGDFDPAATRSLVQQDFGWIPRGKDVVREIPPEPEQTATRRAQVVQAVPLPVVFLGWHVPGYGGQDGAALETLATILGDGESSRLQSLLVNGKDPLCAEIGVDANELEDPGMFSVINVVLGGRNPADVEKAVIGAIAEVAAKGVTAQELTKAKTLFKVDLVRHRETAELLANELGKEALIGGDVNRVNTVVARMEAVTSADIEAVAKKYLRIENAVILRVNPGRPEAPTTAASQPAVVITSPVAPREVHFPADWPTTPPVAANQLAAHFEQGTQTQVNGVNVIVMEDHRLPLVGWELTMRGGSDSDAPGKEGLSDLTTQMLQRGAGGLSYAALNEDLDSHGISLEVKDDRDNTRLKMSCTTDQLDHALQRAVDVLHRPALGEEDFDEVKVQALNNLRIMQGNPSVVGKQELAKALYAPAPMGRVMTEASLNALTIGDIRADYARIYKPGGAFLIITGDISAARGNALAQTLLAKWEPGTPPVADYTRPAPPARQKIILIDNPTSRQATIRMGIPAYDIHDEEKFAGGLASQILSRGIDSRLGRYVRAQRGLAYGVTGNFEPERAYGSFYAGTETKVPTTVPAIESMVKVMNDMTAELVTEKELAEAKSGVAGRLVLGVQTMEDEAEFRAQIILNGYPLNYFDVYPQRLAKVTTQDVRDVMKKYVKPEQMVIVVVAPAAAVKEKLEKLGAVEVRPMPGER